MKSPTAVRVEAIADHMESFGGYTQADEIRVLGAERDRFRAALEEIVFHGGTDPAVAVARLVLKGD